LLASGPQWKVFVQHNRLVLCDSSPTKTIGWIGVRSVGIARAPDSEPRISSLSIGRARGWKSRQPINESAAHASSPVSSGSAFRVSGGILWWFWLSLRRKQLKRNPLPGSPLQWLALWLSYWSYNLARRSVQLHGHDFAFFSIGSLGLSSNKSDHFATFVASTSVPHLFYFSLSTSTNTS
jgi:hypothetical protein